MTQHPRAMRLFFLNIRDGDHLKEDTDGSELPDLEAAVAEAMEAALEILSNRIRQGLQTSQQQIEICDEAGHLLDTVAFQCTFKIG